MLEQVGVLPAIKKKILTKMANKGSVDPVMRFYIIDENKRLFDVERMTYRGMGGWRSLSESMTLPELSQKYLKHLGKESFYDLM